ncbi:recombinase family protein [Pseudomonas sp. R5(2019)]|uniref:recombinase family protein n=1 Tax=Pseudomonas sp. R5(2019) TaxID=2697566 RepID=UPI001412DC63|nr:recombinase family protein [Pseudomonas sp. R5(2019)]NBA96301.1 recombinase family protein [Pseudomonas sp. R5(2019)]
MSRVFVYARVSTEDQTTDNQVQEVRAAGFAVEPQRVIVETISGGTVAMERPGFQKLVERLESSDVLIVTKLDRLGRSAIDVQTTVKSLADRGVKVHCLALGGADLTSSAGKMTMTVLAAVAEFERDLIIERTQAGLARAKAEGRKLGRPVATGTTAQVQRLKAEGKSQREVVESSGLSIATVKRHWSPAHRVRC